MTLFCPHTYTHTLALFITAIVKGVVNTFELSTSYQSTTTATFMRDVCVREGMIYKRGRNRFTKGHSDPWQPSAAFNEILP